MVRTNLKAHADASLKSNANINILWLAALPNSGIIVIKPVTLGIDCDSCCPSGSSLSWAVRYRNHRLAIALIARVADCDKNDSNGWTPLMFEVSNSYTVLVKNLILGGASVDRGNSHGDSGISLALGKGNHNIPHTLLDTT